MESASLAVENAPNQLVAIRSEDSVGTATSNVKSVVPQRRLIRIKRKRCEEPLETLVIEGASEKKCKRIRRSSLLNSFASLSTECASSITKASPFGSKTSKEIEPSTVHSSTSVATLSKEKKRRVVFRRVRTENTALKWRTGESGMERVGVKTPSSVRAQIASNGRRNVSSYQRRLQRQGVLGNRRGVIQVVNEANIMKNDITKDGIKKCDIDNRSGIRKGTEISTEMSEKKSKFQIEETTESNEENVSDTYGQAPGVGKQVIFKKSKSKLRMPRLRGQALAAKNARDLRREEQGRKGDTGQVGIAHKSVSTSVSLVKAGVLMSDEERPIDYAIWQAFNCRYSKVQNIIVEHSTTNPKTSNHCMPVQNTHGTTVDPFDTLFRLFGGGANVNFQRSAADNTTALYVVHFNFKKCFFFRRKNCT